MFLIQPPASFLQAMEEYVREAPRGSTFRKAQVEVKLVFILKDMCGFL